MSESPPPEREEINPVDRFLIGLARILPDDDSEDSEEGAEQEELCALQCRVEDLRAQLDLNRLKFLEERTAAEEAARQRASHQLDASAPQRFQAEKRTAVLETGTTRRPQFLSHEMFFYFFRQCFEFGYASIRIDLASCIWIQ
jgi:hypothetical protein